MSQTYELIVTVTLNSTQVVHVRIVGAFGFSMGCFGKYWAPRLSGLYGQKMLLHGLFICLKTKNAGCPGKDEEQPSARLLNQCVLLLLALPSTCFYHVTC
jgi:hypothetical protein